jgi:membrane protein implicated in regulation of membrane protease activity
MSKRLVDRIPFAKIITVLAIVFGISLGLCGVTFVLSMGGGRSGGGFFVGLGILELVALGVSMAGLLLTLLVFVTLSIFGGFSEKVSQPQKLFDQEDDTKIDKNE